MPRPASRPLCGTSPRARYWLQTDCCGWACATLTWALLAYGWYVTVVWVIVPWRGAWSGHAAAFSLVTALAVWSHLRAMLTNPGAVPEGALPVDGYTTPPPPRCSRCATFKPPHAHHCSVCQRCIVRMDHHCPWINNCVGLATAKFFILFCVYTCAMSTYALALVAVKLVSCAGVRRGGPPADFFPPPPAHCLAPYNVTSTIVTALLCAEALLFGLFTACMLCDQYTSVRTGNTQLDDYKNSRAKQPARPRFGTLRENLALVFGESRWRVWWLIPVDPVWKRLDRVLEFVVPARDPDALVPGDARGADAPLLAAVASASASASAPSASPESADGDVEAGRRAAPVEEHCA